MSDFHFAELSVDQIYTPHTPHSPHGQSQWSPAVQWPRSGHVRSWAVFDEVARPPQWTEARHCRGNPMDLWIVSIGLQTTLVTKITVIVGWILDEYWITCILIDWSGSGFGLKFLQNLISRVKYHHIIFFKCCWISNTHWLQGGPSYASKSLRRQQNLDRSWRWMAKDKLRRWWLNMVD